MSPTTKGPTQGAAKRPRVRPMRKAPNTPVRLEAATRFREAGRRNSHRPNMLAAMANSTAARNRITAGWLSAWPRKDPPRATRLPRAAYMMAMPSQ